jgi:hypothetical protein
MKLAVGVELASLERLAAVEKCSRLSGQRLSDLKTYNSGSRKGPSVHNDLPGRTDNGNPGLGFSIPIYLDSEMEKGHNICVHSKGHMLSKGGGVGSVSIYGWWQRR